jgi:cytochrome P450
VASALDIAGSRYLSGVTASGDLGDTGGVTTTDPTGTVDPNVLLVEAMMTPEGRADPYPRYRALHEHAPVFQSVIDALVVVRYQDCWEVLRDNRMGKPKDGEREMVRISDYQRERMAERNPRDSSMLFLNPPDHTRLRGLVSKAFTPRTVERMRPEILDITDGLLDGIDGEIDVMSTLAFPLPVTVIGRMLGVPEEDRRDFQPVVQAAIKGLEFSMTDEEFDAAMAALDRLNDYFAGLVAERRKQPQDDLLSSLIAARDEGDRLTEEEIVSTSILLFAAGFETTTNLIGNGLYALLSHPDQLRRLRDEPGLIKPAVEETLRWDSPVQIDGRTAFEDVVVAGREVPEGSTVVTLLGAANHDPTHYTEPERFDIGRDEGPPMSFASGIHYCLGAALARLEGQVVFGRVLERFPTLELLDETPHYKDNFVLRGLSELRVEARGA